MERSTFLSTLPYLVPTPPFLDEPIEILLSGYALSLEAVRDTSSLGPIFLKDDHDPALANIHIHVYRCQHYNTTTTTNNNESSVSPNLLAEATATPRTTVVFVIDGYYYQVHLARLIKADFVPNDEAYPSLELYFPGCLFRIYTTTPQHYNSLAQIRTDILSWKTKSTIVPISPQSHESTSHSPYYYSSSGSGGTAAQKNSTPPVQPHAHTTPSQAYQQCHQHLRAIQYVLLEQEQQPSANTYQTLQTLLAQCAQHLSDSYQHNHNNNNQNESTALDDVTREQLTQALALHFPTARQQTHQNNREQVQELLAQVINNSQQQYFPVTRG